MTERVQRGTLQVAKVLDALVEEAASDVGVTSSQFWSSFESIVSNMSPRNRDLLEEREIMQRKIDEWHKGHPGPDYDRTAYRAFLVEIGYLLPEPEPFSITTGLIDEEVSTRPGPQLVVPIMNARYSLNATNARWGSLYDSLYGTNAIPSDGGAEATPGEYNPIRGARVIAFAKTFLNDSCPLADGSSHTEVSAYTVDTSAPSKARLCAELSSGGSVGLLCPEQFKGYNGPATAPTNILLEHNGLHIDIHIDRSSVIGGSDSAGVRDVVLESAMTAIQDCEDSVAAVDAADKALVYRNWLGLMRGDLTEEVSKNGKTFNRTLNPDRHYIAVDGSDLQLKGRSLLFIRNVGHLMRNEAILDGNNEEVFEGIMDAMFTALIALYDLNKKGVGACNSRTGSVYIVKPKMHGPEEVSFTCDLFDRVEDAMGMPRHTLKLGIMDEERRTTVNLKECIRRARDRVVFVNTGFLDRTGDEIHTSMHAGIITPKSEMKKEKWLSAYERWNAAIGLQCGFKGRAQIGKGMWATPDLMDAMLAEKGGHLRAGASTSWVPSPTAATLHATHYHAHDVSAIQEKLLQQLNANPNLDDVLSDILYVPLVAAGVTLAPEMVQRELDNNAQGILGYVVRWINNGVGCSKIPDINNVGLMEDRATLRISSQYIANWLLHNVCSPEQVQETLKRMAAIVDTQNVGPDYQPMSADFDNSVAFQAAVALVFEGMRQPSGYTEPILHARRRELKATR